MRRAERGPLLDAGAPGVGIALLGAEPDLDAELLARPAGRVGGGVQSLADVGERACRVGIARAAERIRPEPYVTARRTAAGPLPPSQIGMLRIAGGLRPTSSRLLAAELGGHAPLRPEPPQQRDLRVHALAARVEVLAQRLVLERVPADAEPEPQPAAGEHVDLRRLLGRRARSGAAAG